MLIGLEDVVFHVAIGFGIGALFTLAFLHRCASRLPRARVVKSDERQSDRWNQ